MPQRNVTITQRQDDFVQAVLKSGHYGNVSEVFRAGLRLLEREQLELGIKSRIYHRELDKGRESLESGDYIAFDNADELEEWGDKTRKEMYDRWKAENAE